MSRLTIAEYNKKRGVDPAKKAPESWDAKDFEFLSKLLEKRTPKSIINKIYRLINEYKNPYHTVLQARTVKLELNDRYQNTSNQSPIQGDF